jgi:hypothetical protein
MALSAVEREHVIQLLDELPGETLPEVVRFLEYLKFKVQQAGGQPMTESEEALVKRIQQKVSPEITQRLATLRAQQETGELAESERAELLRYVDEVEQRDADRAEALLKLAQRLDLPVEDLIRQLTSDPAAYAG